MKKNITVISALLYLLTSCGDMLESIQPFLDEGEKIYVGRIEAFSAMPGNNRVQLIGLLPYGVTQTGCRIELLDPEGQRETLDFPFNRDELELFRDWELFDDWESMGDYPMLRIILDKNLKEGEYQFWAVTYDSKGNESIPVEASGYVYGELYQETLTNRIVSQVSSTMVIENGMPVIIDGKIAYNALIAWRAFYDAQALGSELEIELEDGSFDTLFIPTTEVQTTISYKLGYKKGGILRWRTVYMPVEFAIDQFYTGYSEAKLPAN